MRWKADEKKKKCNNSLVGAWGKEGGARIHDAIALRTENGRERVQDPRTYERTYRGGVRQFC